VAVTLIDYAIPVMILAARDLGLTGSETAEEFAGRAEARARIETLRLEAGRRMGLGDVRRSVTPKVALVSPPGQGGTIRSLYLTPWGVHKSHAVTGGLAVAVAATLDGTVAAHVIGGTPSPDGAVRLEHAAGTMSIGLAPAPGGAPTASILRTARKLFEGHVLIPANVWDGAAGRAAAESSRAAA
jgi:2-methylaconitate cis-trans-isomerase PrpF